MRTNYLSQKENKINDFILTNQGKFKEHEMLMMLNMYL